MHWYQLVVLALVQGVTEFLPISSSAHLILVPYLFGWADQGLGYDLAVHLGTLVAVIAYFWRDVETLLVAWIKSMTAGRRDTDVVMAWGLILATLPAVILGGVVGILGEQALRLPAIIATTSIVFGIALGLADYYARADRQPDVLGWRAYLAIGCAQAIAIIPGSSRSGMTIMGARMAGLTRRAAARVSFFMAIPITLAAIAFEILELAGEPASQPWGGMALAALLAGVSAFVTIHYFLRLLQSVGMLGFVIYRILLGVLLFAVFGW